MTQQRASTRARCSRPTGRAARRSRRTRRGRTRSAARPGAVARNHGGRAPRGSARVSIRSSSYGCPAVRGACSRPATRLARRTRACGGRPWPRPARGSRACLGELGDQLRQVHAGLPRVATPALSQHVKLGALGRGEVGGSLLGVPRGRGRYWRKSLCLHHYAVGVASLPTGWPTVSRSDSRPTRAGAGTSGQPTTTVVISMSGHRLLRRRFCCHSTARLCRRR